MPIIASFVPDDSFPTSAAIFFYNGSFDNALKGSEY